MPEPQHFVDLSVYLPTYLFIVTSVHPSVDLPT